MNETLKKLRPFKLISFLMATFIRIGGLIPIYFLPIIIDVWIPAKDLHKTGLSLFILSGIPICLTFANTIYKVYLSVRIKELTDTLREKCFDRLLHQPMSFFDEVHSAELAKKCTQEATEYITIESVDKPQLHSDISICIILLVLLYRIHPLLSIGQLLYFPIIYPLMKTCGKKLEGYIHQIMEGNAQRSKVIQEGFHSIRTLKSTRQEHLYVNKLNGVQYQIRRIWKKDVTIESLIGGLSSTFLPSVFYGLTFILSAILIIKGEGVTIGMLTSAIGYSGRIHAIFHTLLTTMLGQKKAKAEASVVEKYLNLPDERTDSGKLDWNFTSEIRFSDVTFRYKDSTPNVLEHISLTFPHGKWIGLNGQSGVGKTTILELILRFYSCQSGIITVDGVGIEEIQLDEVRKNIGYVPQEPFLLDLTVAENLRLASVDATDKELFDVLKKVGLENKFGADQLHEHIGEGGLNISGGERQRLAIAQCLLRGTSVILLDEATSQLDEENQFKIRDIFKELCRNGITIISVAHRSQFNQDADIEYTIE